MNRIRSSIALTTVLSAVAFLTVAGVTAAGENDLDAEKLWKWLQEEDYRSWAPYPGTPDDFYEGTRPHGAQLRTYVNDVAEKSPDELPDGSVIVKENYTPEKELAAVTVMKRSSGYDPDNQDWYWVKYEPDGSVAQMEGRALAGKVQSCIGCHASAGGDDYVYTNDER